MPALDASPPGGGPRCRCGHARAAHEHLRRGTDCSLCPAGACARWRPGLLGRLRGLLAR